MVGLLLHVPAEAHQPNLVLVAQLHVELALKLAEEVALLYPLVLTLDLLFKQGVIFCDFDIIAEWRKHLCKILVLEFEAAVELDERALRLSLLVLREFFDERLSDLVNHGGDLLVRQAARLAHGPLPNERFSN